LLVAGRAHETAERSGAAADIDRGNLRYALAHAMLAEGRAPEAEPALKALLDRADTDRTVNLAMAHTMLREGRVDEATSYFHRAIVGH
jgi:thioredoxin-like negative regulator of GroEL